LLHIIALFGVGKVIMFSKFGRQFFAPPVAYVVGWLQAAGVTPNALTYTGFLLTAVTALLLAGGYFRWGALLLFIASFFDMLDGSLARATSQSSPFGAFLDSTLDRYSESITLLALAIHYSRIPETRTELVLVFVILVGSLMVSYTRARAEALNLECKAGMLQRPERIVLLIIGLLTGWIQPILWIMAILTNVSAIQRIYEVYTLTNQRQPVAPTPKIVQPSDQPPLQP
jgi:CDP-diacylglycerol---glycerol-3-phosphate 3-phosphatidyltransferase